MQISNNCSQAQKTSFSSVIPIYNVFKIVKGFKGAADTFERIVPPENSAIFKALSQRLKMASHPFASKLKKVDSDFAVTPYCATTHVGRGTIIERNLFTGQDAYDLRSMQRNNCCGLERVENINERIKYNYINNSRKQLRAQNGERLGMNLFVKQKGKKFIVEDLEMVRESQRNNVLKQQEILNSGQASGKKAEPLPAPKSQEVPKTPITIANTPYRVDFIETEKKRGRKRKIKGADNPNLPGF